MRLRSRSKKVSSESLAALEQAVEELLAHTEFLESENEKLRRSIVTQPDESQLHERDEVIRRLQDVIRSKDTTMAELQDAFREQRKELDRQRQSPQSMDWMPSLLALLEKIERLENLIFAPQESRG